MARLDSGADISLILQSYLDTLQTPQKPRMRRGIRMNLFQLTNGFKIEGFVQLPILIQAEDGDWLSFEGEFYVVPGMTSPMLLGEDFQVNYELGVHRSVEEGSSLEVLATGHTFMASSVTPQRDTMPFCIIGRGASASFVKAKSHQRNRAHRRKLRHKHTTPTVRATQDYTIQPHSCRPIPVSVGAAQGDTWFAEKTVLRQADGSCLLTTPTILDTSHAFIAVSNTTDRPVHILCGDVLSKLRDPSTFFQQQEEDLSAHATAVRTLIAECMASEGIQPEDADDRWGPKMAELPNATVYPSKDMEQLLDIGPDWPPAECKHLINMLRSRQQAFAFDGRLGHNPTTVEIKVAPGMRLVSLPMYAASPAKREVIDKQHNAWMAMDVIEPSMSPWAAPVLIAYRNSKPWFCIDYRRLNALTIPDEFPIPRQSEILQALSGAQVLSSLDALSRFTQLTVAEEDRKRTAFRTHRGLFQFCRLPFGLRNGPSIRKNRPGPYDF